MSISVNTSQTASLRVALSSNVANSVLAAQQLATGDAIINAYQDPSGLSIGAGMKSSYNILSVVARGMEQSKAMLYIAEDGLKNAINSVERMQKILANAKLGFMTDELIKNTLAPEYNQLKSEINRIANQTKFNGTTLLNGTSGTKNLQVAGTTGSLGPKTYDFSNALLTAMFNETPATALPSAGMLGTVTGGTTGETGLTIVGQAGTQFSVTGGAMSAVGTDIKITGATLTILGASYAGITTAADTGKVDITMNVDLTFPAAVAPLATTNGVVNGIAATFSNPTGYSFSNFVSSAGNAVSDFTWSSIDLAPAALETTSKIINVLTVTDLVGSIPASSTFEFTASDALTSDLKVTFPNINLDDNGSIQSVISTLNIKGYTSLSGQVPNVLSNLSNEADADADIPLVNALHGFLVIQRGQMGAYESRFMAVEQQLASNLEQLDNAQGAVLNTDLAKSNEDFARANIKVTIAIAMLKQMNEQLQGLARIVQ